VLLKPILVWPTTGFKEIIGSAAGAKVLRVVLISTHDSFLLLESILVLHVSIYVSVNYILLPVNILNTCKTTASELSMT
jgi:hypothetical protein